MKTFFFSQDFEVTSHDNEISQYLFDFIENLLNLGGGKTHNFFLWIIEENMPCCVGV